MIQVTTTNATVATNANIPFNTVVFRKGCAVKRSGIDSLSLKPGTYLVQVDASLTSSTATTGPVSIQLVKDGALIGIPNSENVGDATNSHSLNLTALVDSPKSNTCNCSSEPTQISVRNVGNAAIADLNIVVTKVAD
jgi:hypothetical protein